MPNLSLTRALTFRPHLFWSAYSSVGTRLFGIVKMAEWFQCYVSLASKIRNQMSEVTLKVDKRTFFKKWYLFCKGQKCLWRSSLYQCLWISGPLLSYMCWIYSEMNFHQIVSTAKYYKGVLRLRVEWIVKVEQVRPIPTRKSCVDANMPTQMSQVSKMGGKVVFELGWAFFIFRTVEKGRTWQQEMECKFTGRSEITAHSSVTGSLLLCGY